MFGLTLKEKINKMGDKEVLEHMADLIKDRNVVAGVRFIEDPTDDLILGYQSVLICGGLMLPAEPVRFDWPMQFLPIPDALKGDYGDDNDE